MNDCAGYSRGKYLAMVYAGAVVHLKDRSGTKVDAEASKEPVRRRQKW
jgi:hypothetical protein